MHALIINVWILINSLITENMPMLPVFTMTSLFFLALTIFPGAGKN